MKYHIQTVENGNHYIKEYTYMNLKECIKNIIKKIFLKTHTTIIMDDLKKLDKIEQQLKDYYNLIYPYYLIYKAVKIIKKEISQL